MKISISWQPWDNHELSNPGQEVWMSPADEADGQKEEGKVVGILVSVRCRSVGRPSSERDRRGGRVK